MYQCSGDHQHTHLEGGVRGRGARSKMAENYPEKMAAIIAECLAYQPTEDEVLAAEDLELETEENEDQPEEPAAASAPRQSEAEMETEDAEVIRSNKELKKQVGIRPFDYVARLHKNLGHPSSEVLVQMLKEVQATEDVILAAKHYLCKSCYHRMKPGQAPPAAGISSTVFNHRLQCDSSWIQVAEGRRCVLTICDEATRFIALRLLKSEKSTEFIKGVERAWVRHFGMPKIIRVDSAKGWSASAIREWTSERGIALEVSPAEAHSWLAAVERKHQVTRRALELYMEDINSVTNNGLEEACIHVPPRINQLSWTRGFSPYQWVIGKTPSQDLSLTSELYNPGMDPDDATSFTRTQEKRMRAACAFLKADSDAKLRRAMNQKYMEMKHEIRLGQTCYYWRIQGSGHLKKNKWRGPAVCIAHETSKETGRTMVLWLVHGTSLLRCAPQHVRPAVEDANVQVAHNPGAALKALEDLKARSTTQFRDMLSKQKGARDMVMEEIMDEEYEEDGFQQLEAEEAPGDEYSPTIGEKPTEEDMKELENEFDRIAEEERIQREAEEEARQAVPGIVTFMLPHLHDRERTPRRTERPAITAPEPELQLQRDAGDAPEAEDESPTKKLKSSGSKKQRTGSKPKPSMAPAQAAGSQPPPPEELPELPQLPEAEDDELMVEDVMFVDTSSGRLPPGWICVDNVFEIDEVWMATEGGVRKGEVTERKMNVDERAEFIKAKMKELQTFFSNSVWEFATPEFVEKNKMRMITARWVLTWKWDEENLRPKAKARLVLRGFEDPDLYGLEKSSPTAGRSGKMWILCLASIYKWNVICGDVRAAFLSGAGFSREIIVKLPKDCAPLLGLRADEVAYMKMLKSAYGLADAPLLWFREASKRLERIGFRSTELDRCTFGWYDAQHQLQGMVIIHVDDLLIAGSQQCPEFVKAVENLKNSFDFGKWDVLSQKKSLMYCGGQVAKDGEEITLSYEEYIKKILPLTIPKGRGATAELTEYEKTKARGLLGALQWPGAQGVPALLASTSILASEIAVNKGEVMQNLNKTLRFAKQNAQVSLKMTPHVNDLQDGVLVAFVDAAFGVRHDHASQGGFIIVHTHKDILTGAKCKYSVISWKSFKLQRVVRSSLGAEAQAMATTAEELYFTKLFLKMMRNPMMTIKECQERLKEDRCAIVTDCKALYDTLKRANIQGTQDKRVAVECLVINQTLKDAGAELRWVSSERQIADGLTKLSARQNFVEQLRGGYIQLVYDEEFKAAKKKTPTERRESMRQTTSTIAWATSAAVMSGSLQGCSGSADDGAEMTLWLVTMFVAIGIAAVLKHLRDGVKAISNMLYPCENTATHEQVVQTPAAWDELYQANQEIARLNYIHGEEKELRIMADQQVRRLERELEDRTENLSEVTLRIMHYQTRIAELEEQARSPSNLSIPPLGRPNLFVTRSGECWHVNRACGHIRGRQITMFRPCTDRAGRE